jgi:hypothetical protein
MLKVRAAIWRRQKSLSAIRSITWPSTSITGKDPLHHSTLPLFYYQPVSPVNIGGLKVMANMETLNRQIR